MIINVEFYITPNGGIMVQDGNGVRRLTPQERNFVSEMIDRIGDFYPEALTALSSEYNDTRHNIPAFEHKIVVRFIKCNWGKYDSRIDIDQFGSFNFEEVECPLRGECPLENVVCKPKFNSRLSDRELEIMQLMYENLSIEVIANRLYLSVETIKTHKRNAFKRTNVHSLPEFIIYARDKGLFK